jgi:hypothetical protein
MSEILVGAAEATGHALGMSPTFIGIVLVAVVGGAAGSAAANAMARKNQMDLAVGIAMWSCIQIALFVPPVLVLSSALIAPKSLTLEFSRLGSGPVPRGAESAPRSRATGARTATRASCSSRSTSSSPPCSTCPPR